MKERNRILLIGTLVALTSELYWNVFIDGFRISSSVILLPVLLMTVGKELSTSAVCTASAAAVLLLRTAIALLTGAAFADAALRVLPNAVFYLCYGLLFGLLLPNKHTASWRILFPTLFFSDLFSNVIELLLFELVGDRRFSLSMAGSLALIALFRALLATAVLLAEYQYRALLKQEEHENRYHRLFMMTTSLKNELYFMRKNTEEIEAIMTSSYLLYERLSDMEVPEELKRASLSIARDVHEIKKDYLRIIQGMEKEISEDYDEKQMRLRDIVRILKTTSHHMLETRNLHIRLDFRCRDDFVTENHYELMAILKNLVSNAAEAIEADSGRGTIRLEEWLTDGFYLFSVSDDGPGIPARHLPCIFQMGYSTKADKITGSYARGVGLYGVRATVEELFGGTIDVESTEGQGAVFTVRIPMASFKEAAE